MYLHLYIFMALHFLLKYQTPRSCDNLQSGFCWVFVPHA